MRITPQRAVVAATVAMLALLIGWTVHELSQKNLRRSGSNHVDLPHFVANADRGQAICQTETIPKDTGAMMMLVTSYNRPTPTVTFTALDAAGRRLARGRLVHGWVQGPKYIPLEPEITRTTTGRLCVADDGPNPITIAGENVDPVSGATVAGRRVGGRMSIQFYRPGNESYLSIASLVLARVRFGKASWFGPWLPVLVVLLILACLGGAIYLAVRPWP